MCQRRRRCAHVVAFVAVHEPRKRKRADNVVDRRAAVVDNNDVHLCVALARNGLQRTAQERRPVFRSNEERDVRRGFGRNVRRRHPLERKGSAAGCSHCAAHGVGRRCRAGPAAVVWEVAGAPVSGGDHTGGVQRQVTNPGRGQSGGHRHRHPPGSGHPHGSFPPCTQHVPRRMGRVYRPVGRLVGQRDAVPARWAMVGGRAVLDQAATVQISKHRQGIETGGSGCLCLGYQLGRAADPVHPLEQRGQRCRHIVEDQRALLIQPELQATGRTPESDAAWRKPEPLRKVAR